MPDDICIRCKGPNVWPDGKKHALVCFKCFNELDPGTREALAESEKIHGRVFHLDAEQLWSVMLLTLDCYQELQDVKKALMEVETHADEWDKATRKKEEPQPTPEGFEMRSYIEEACDGIDAAIFSGDAFADPQHRQGLRWYMARWERGLKEHDETFPEGPCDTEDHDG